MQHPVLRIFVATLCLAAASQAGLLMVSSHQNLTEKRAPESFKVYLEKTAVRVEAGQDGNFFIYRPDKQIFWMINDNEKTFTEMTKKDLEAIGAQMDAAMKMMEEQLKNLPPEQRKMMEGMLKSQMGGASANQSKPVFKKTGTGKVAGIECDKYETLIDGKKKSESCIATPKKLKAEDAEYESYRELAQFFAKLVKNMETYLGPIAHKDAPPGVSLEVVSYDEGKAVAKMETKELKKQDIPASMFELPKGYARKQMGKME